MNSQQTPQPDRDGGSKKPRAFHPFFPAAVLIIAAVIGWAFWPANPQESPYDLSRADGKPRFYVTAYRKMQMPANFSLRQKLYWVLREFERRHGKHNPAAYTFAASPVRLCSIPGLLNQCMDVTGTRYFIAVEIAGAVEFGNTNALKGAQWVAAFEHAIETSGPVTCYDYTKKRNFQDTLRLIHERPGVVKVIPRTKLAEYQKAGLVKAGSP